MIFSYKMLIFCSICINFGKTNAEIYAKAYLYIKCIWSLQLSLNIIQKIDDCEKLSLKNQQNLEIEIFGYKEVILGQFINTLDW